MCQRRWAWWDASGVKTNKAADHQNLKEYPAITSNLERQTLPSDHLAKKFMKNLKD